jgi:hypothetical protein
MELVKHNGGKRPAVLFGTPTFEKSVSCEFHNSLFDSYTECLKNGITIGHLLVAGNQFIDVARNRIVHEFLTSPVGFTDLIMVDADQGWDAKVIPRIVNYSQGVVAALPPKKLDEPTFHDNAIRPVSEDGLFQCLEAGTGFMRIKREVFARMDKNYPELAQMVDAKDGWPHTPYFQRGTTKYGGFLGEDIFFCRQLISMGEFIWIDMDVNFTHRGSKVWEGNFYEYAVRSGKLRKAI